jgi:hypothetical protein
VINRAGKSNMTVPLSRDHRFVDWLIMVLAPLFFASNLVYGRGIGTSVAPFTLAFVRWQR